VSVNCYRCRKEISSGGIKDIFLGVYCTECYKEITQPDSKYLPPLKGKIKPKRIDEVQ
jgi:hypothetical protein